VGRQFLVQLSFRHETAVTTATAARTWPSQKSVVAAKPATVAAASAWNGIAPPTQAPARSESGIAASAPSATPSTAIRLPVDMQPTMGARPFRSWSARSPGRYISTAVGDPGWHLKNSGSGWTVTAQACSGSSSICTAGLPKRYISGVRIDTANPSHAYLSLSGYSRKWMIGPDDPGAGHVFESTTGGLSWTDVSGNLPDVPMDDIVFERGNLVVATDFGGFTSSNDGAAWSRFGTGLPNVVVDQLTEDPNGNLVAATHGRGVWTIAAP
jgi:hypothetical protein